MANVGTMVMFRVGPEDAQLLAKEFGPTWPWSDLVNLDPYEVCGKIMRYGKVKGPVRGFTIAASKRMPQDNHERYKQELIEASRQRYSRPRDKVERAIAKFFAS